MHYDIVEQDNKIRFQVTCTDPDGVVINLSGCTVAMAWQIGSAAVENRPMIILDAPNGLAAYYFLAGEMQSPVMSIDVTVTKGDGTVITNLDPILVAVRKRTG